jgi:hypothetical protein
MQFVNGFNEAGPNAAKNRAKKAKKKAKAREKNQAEATDAGNASDVVMAEPGSEVHASGSHAKASPLCTLASSSVPKLTLHVHLQPSGSLPAPADKEEPEESAAFKRAQHDSLFYKNVVTTRQALEEEVDVKAQAAEHKRLYAKYITTDDDREPSSLCSLALPSLELTSSHSCGPCHT